SQRSFGERPQRDRPQHSGLHAFPAQDGDCAAGRARDDAAGHDDDLRVAAAVHIGFFDRRAMAVDLSQYPPQHAVDGIRILTRKSVRGMRESGSMYATAVARVHDRRYPVIGIRIGWRGVLAVYEFAFHNGDATAWGNFDIFEQMCDHLVVQQDYRNAELLSQIEGADRFLVD